jgi:protein-tyrosine phosphatase
MSRAGANTIVDGRLYQRGQFLTWPHAQKWGLVERLGVTLVVNMWSKADPDLSCDRQGWVYLCWPTSPSEVPGGADAVVGFVANLVGAGYCALVHCEAGRGRSVWMAARVLSVLEGIPRKDALRRVELLVPSHNLTVALRRDLED